MWAEKAVFKKSNLRNFKEIRQSQVQQQTLEIDNDETGVHSLT